MSNKPPKIVIPGLNRGAGIPAGYVLGRRQGTGQGPAQLLDLTQLQAFGVAPMAYTAQEDLRTASTAASATDSLSASVSTQISSVVSTNVTQSTSLSQISSSLSGAISTNVGQSTSLSQISSSLSGAISSTTSLSTAVSTVISGSVSTLNSRIDSLSAAGGGGGVAVQDEGIAVVAATTLNFIGAGVTATDAGGGVAQIDIPAGAAASSTSLSQISSSLSSEISSRISGDTSLSTVISSSISTTLSTAASATASLSTAIGAGGGAAWTLAGTGQTATGVYDFAVDGVKTNIDFVGLAGYNELLIIVDGLAYGTTGVRAVRASVDNGSTFYSSSGDYKTVSVAGVEANTDAFAFHTTNSTSARSLIAHISNMKGVAKHCRYAGTQESLFDASASDINAVRIYNSGGGNSSAGTVRVYAR